MINDNNNYNLRDILKKISIGHKMNKEYMHKYCYVFIKCLLKELLSKKSFRIQGLGTFYARKTTSKFIDDEGVLQKCCYFSPKFKLDPKIENFLNNYNPADEYSHLTKKGINVKQEKED